MAPRPGIVARLEEAPVSDEVAGLVQLFDEQAGHQVKAAVVVVLGPGQQHLELLADGQGGA